MSEFQNRRDLPIDIFGDLRSSACRLSQLKPQPSGPRSRNRVLPHPLVQGYATADLDSNATHVVGRANRLGFGSYGDLREMASTGSYTYILNNGELSGR